MQILEFLASIVGSLFLVFCAIFTLWMFLPQISFAIFGLLGLWIYFQGYPWIGLVVAIGGTIAGCMVGMTVFGFGDNDVDDIDSPNSSKVTDDGTRSTQ